MIVPPIQRGPAPSGAGYHRSLSGSAGSICYPSRQGAGGCCPGRGRQHRRGTCKTPVKLKREDSRGNCHEKQEMQKACWLKRFYRDLEEQGFLHVRMGVRPNGGGLSAPSVVSNSPLAMIGCSGDARPIPWRARS